MIPRIRSPLACDFPIPFFALFFLLVALAGCDNGTGSALKVLHGCELFTVAEIEAIIEASVENPPRETHKVNENDDFWMSMCNYYSPEANTSLGIMIQPNAQFSGDAQKAFDSYVASLKKSMPDYEVTPVADIGQKSMWNEDASQLTIFTDSHMVLITSMKAAAPASVKFALARKVAQQTLEKLQ